ncbi:hypothetical protein PENNAL_c0375G05048, partial [Penicillium nalgiovense]
MGLSPATIPAQGACSIVPSLKGPGRWPPWRWGLALYCLPSKPRPPSPS